MELITPCLRNEFREFCVAYLFLSQIHDIFTRAGIKRGQVLNNRLLKGARRPLVEKYYASLNWQEQADVAKFLQVIEYALAQRYLTAAPRQHLRDLCVREGLMVDGLHVYQPSDPPLNRP